MTDSPVMMDAASVSAAFWGRIESSSASLIPMVASDQTRRVTDLGIAIAPSMRADLAIPIHLRGRSLRAVQARAGLHPDPRQWIEAHSSVR